MACALSLHKRGAAMIYILFHGLLLTTGIEEKVSSLRLDTRVTSEDDSIMIIFSRVLRYLPRSKQHNIFRGLSKKIHGPAVGNHYYKSFNYDTETQSVNSARSLTL